MLQTKSSGVKADVIVRHAADGQPCRLGHYVTHCHGRHLVIYSVNQIVNYSSGQMVGWPAGQRDEQSNDILPLGSFVSFVSVRRVGLTVILFRHLAIAFESIDLAQP